MRDRGLRKRFAVAGLLVSMGAAVAWWPRGDASPLREVDTSPTAHLRGDSRYSVTVQPDQYTVAATSVSCSPIGAGGVVILDFGSAACVANLSAPGHMRDLPTFSRQPTRRICVAPSPSDGEPEVETFHAPEATAIRWVPGSRRLEIVTGHVVRIIKSGDPRADRTSIAVPFMSVYVGQGDFHTSGLVGCSALALYDGQTTIFAHCLPHATGYAPADIETAITVQNVVDRIDAFLDRTRRQWSAHYAAATREDGEALKTALAHRGIAADGSVIGVEGWGAHFSTRTKTLIVVPELP